jgi:hypothetical protein
VRLVDGLAGFRSGCVYLSGGSWALKFSAEAF